MQKNAAAGEILGKQKKLPHLSGSFLSGNLNNE